MPIPDLTPKEAVRPFFRALAWLMAACSAVGALGALWSIIFEPYLLRERVALVLLILVMALGLWTFLLAALGRNAKPPERRLNVLLGMLPVVCLAGIAWEFFSAPQPTRELIWLTVLAVVNIAWLYSFVSGKARLRYSP